MKSTAGSSPTVTIACKIGVPWIDAELCEPREIQENTQTGPRPVTQWFRTGKKFRIRGTAYPRGEAPEGFPAKPEIVAGYALTRDIPRALWEEWAKQHARAPYVASGMIFAFDRIEDIKARASEMTAELSGLEPIARSKDAITDPRLSRSNVNGVSSISPGIKTAA